jgi:hypothetical protein
LLTSSLFHTALPKSKQREIAQAPEVFDLYAAPMNRYDSLSFQLPERYRNRHSSEADSICQFLLSDLYDQAAMRQQE